MRNHFWMRKKRAEFTLITDLHLFQLTGSTEPNGHMAKITRNEIVSQPERSLLKENIHWTKFFFHFLHHHGISGKFFKFTVAALKLSGRISKKLTHVPDDTINCLKKTGLVENVVGKNDTL